MISDRGRRTYSLVCRAAAIAISTSVLATWGPEVLAQAPAERAVLREGRGKIEGTITQVNRGGVLIAMQAADGAEASAQKWVAWDRVKQIEGSSEMSVQAKPFAELSEDLWRARSRVERSDTLSAEELFAAHAAEFATESGPSAATVFEGLVRCRLARGARAGALAAWLSWLGVMDRSGAVNGDGVVAIPTNWVGGIIAGAPWMDSRTGLVPELPPIWIDEPAISSSATAGDWVRAAGGAEPKDTIAMATASELAAWYTAAAQFEATGQSDTSTWPRVSGTSEGVRLVLLIVQARAGDDNRRAAARESLRAMMNAESSEPWTEAWCRAAIGRSLLRESDPSDRIRGVIELLHVPARLASVSPVLAGVCLAEAAVAMQELGDSVVAIRLKQELLTRFPGHAATGWIRLQGIQSESAALTAKQSAGSLSESLPEPPHPDASPGGPP